jgi:hypothetical protein
MKLPRFLVTVGRRLAHAIGGTVVGVIGFHGGPTLLRGEPLWEPAAALPVGVAGFAHGVCDGRIVVAGGTAWDRGEKRCLDRVWRFDPARNTWTESAPLPRPYCFGGFARIGARLILAGGDDGQRTHTDVLAVDTRPTTISTIAEPLAYAGSAGHDRWLYLLGGTHDLHDLARTSASFRAIDLATGRTEALPDYPGGPVIHAALVFLGEDLFVFPGGLVDPATRKVADSRAAWRYRFGERRWAPIAAYPFPVRGLAACALDPGRALLAGGHRSRTNGEEGPTAECFLYDSTADAYRAVEPLPSAAMLMGLERVRGRLYAFGGEDRAKHRSTAVYRAPVERLLATEAASP